jgi:hypothetical protein
MGKCSLCGKYGHNKRTCKLKDINNTNRCIEKTDIEKTDIEKTDIEKTDIEKTDINKYIESENKFKQQLNTLKNININDEIYMISYKGISYIYHEKNNNKFIIDSKSNIIGVWKKGEIHFY